VAARRGRGLDRGAWLVPFACVIVLGACAAPPPPPPPKPVPEVMDGFYRGTSTRFLANNRSCPRPGLVSVQVWDRRFQYKWSYGVLIDAVILPDGTVQGSAAGISLLGRHAGTKLEGDVTNGECGLHFTLTLRDK
jgi:hypothetical protein